MGSIKDRLAELYGSEYPKGSKTSGKRIRLTKIAVGSFKKRLRILSEAIEELNHDIQKRELISQQVQGKLDREISHLEFVLKELENWKLGQVDIIETRRLGLEKELIGLRYQKRSEYVKAWSDISTLERKRMEFIIEYKELLKTIGMLDIDKLHED